MRFTLSLVLAGLLWAALIEARLPGEKHPVTLCSYTHKCAKGECGLQGYGAELYYDLSLLTRNVSKPLTVDYSITIDEWIYYVNVCADTKQTCLSKGVGDAIRVSQTGISQCQILGDSISEWNLMQPDEAKAGVEVTFIGGDSGGGCSTNRTVTMTFTCSEGVEGELVSVVEVSPSCDFQVNFVSKYGCPIIVYAPPPKKETEGLSGGSVFLIIFFVAAFVYVVGGFGYNMKMKDKRGMEAFPHHTFWFVQFPGYVKDGVKFTTATVTGTCRKESKEEYEEVNPQKAAAGAVNSTTHQGANSADL